MSPREFHGAAWRILANCRHNAARYRRIATIWNDLDIGQIKACDDPELLAALPGLIEGLRLRPLRGQRAGTKWELVNMAIRNRLWQIDRAKPLGGFDHNSKGAA